MANTANNANTNSKPQKSNQVIVHVYDITKGSARRNTFGLIEGIWHTGLEIFGQEYFYCMHGVLTCIPKEYELGTYHRSIPMGETMLTEQQFKLRLEYLKGIIYTGEKYCQISHNCNNFTDDMTRLLVGRNIPDKSIIRF